MRLIGRPFAQIEVPLVDGSADELAIVNYLCLRGQPLRLDLRPLDAILYILYGFQARDVFVQPADGILIKATTLNVDQQHLVFVCVLAAYIVRNRGVFRPLLKHFLPYGDSLPLAVR